MTGVKFNGQHTWDDWRIIMTKRTVGLPEVQTNYVQVPGRNGAIDLTTALTGEVRYYQRELEFTFETTERVSETDWATLLSKIASYIHGQEVEIVMDDDKAFYYKGRAELNKYETLYGLQTIVIDCICEPYKYDIESPGQPWLWDPFSFVSGVIYNTQTTVEGTATVEFINRSMRVIPTFICSDAMTVTFEGKTYDLKAGTNIIYEITFDPDATTPLTFTGNGTVNVIYEVGVL